jgi:hypothetical protein
LNWSDKAKDFVTLPKTAKTRLHTAEEVRSSKKNLHTNNTQHLMHSYLTANSANKPVSQQNETGSAILELKYNQII